MIRSVGMPRSSSANYKRKSVNRKIKTPFESVCLPLILYDTIKLLASQAP